MGSDDGTPPKLSLLISRPSKPPEMGTPPLHAAVSIPFQWEEAPGKPRHRPTESKPKIARTLDLPPRLLFSEAKVSNAPSPTTVLDGPYMGRTMSFTASNRNASKDYWNGNFGSSRWRSFKENKEEAEEEAVEGRFDFSNCTADGRTTRVRISRAGVRRRGSFFGNTYNSRSHFWVDLLPIFSFMGKVTTSSSEPLSSEASYYDEVFMQQSLVFDDSLKDLKNLRTQLYSAAEYFELSYTNDDQNQIVAETLKDYTVKALVNTVDHLGSVTYKVNDLLDEKVVEVSGTELRVSCIEQRMRTCQEFMDHQGRVQQSLVISTPKYHKRYILPVGETTHGPNRPKSKYVGCNLALDDEDRHHFKSAVRATIREVPTSAPRSRKGRSPSPSPSLQTQRPASFSSTSTFPKRDSEKRTVSPHRFPLFRSGSLSSRPTTPKSSRPTTPNKSRPTTPTPSIERRWYPSEPRKSASMRLSAERGRDLERNSSKGKRFLKALLSKPKSKKDEMLYTYLDEYL